MQKLLTFDEAIKDSAQYSKRHLLLGNGFSIDHNSEFHYSSLYEEANFSNCSEIKGIFEKLRTQNFEYVIQNLEDQNRIDDAKK